MMSTMKKLLSEFYTNDLDSNDLSNFFESEALLLETPTSSFANFTNMFLLDPL